MLTRNGFAAAVTLATAGVFMALGTDLPSGKFTSEDSFGQRYLTHVSTDKPIYRGGERVYVRGVVLHADTHKPLADGDSLMGQVEIAGPKGDRVAGGYVAMQDSVLGFAWDVPAEQAGGEYVVRISYPGYGLASGERKFDIRAYRPPRLKSQIVFLRDGYGPGDAVAATAHIERAEGGVPAGAAVTAIARVDGEEVYRGQTAIDDRGQCSVAFDLPKTIDRGEGTLALVIEDGGVSETAAKTIPILLQTLDLAFYPEGGDLVANLPARVYVEAKTPAQKPADIAGAILDDKGNIVSTFRTEHEGRGRLLFTPRFGIRYVLKVNEPSGIKTEFPLPEVKADGAVIRAVDETIGRDDPVRLRVGSAKAGKLNVSLRKHNVEVAAVMIDVQSTAMADVVLTPPEGVDGVLAATVFDETGVPLAERLVFRRPAKTLNVNIQPNSDAYVPGAPVELTVKTTDENGAPVGAVVGVTVTDDAVLEMIEKREQAPRLPVMVLIEPEVRELADAHVYLDDANPKSALALDLLLGTQGWRRFAFQKADEFLAKNPGAGQRVLAPALAAGWRDTRAAGGDFDFAVRGIKDRLLFVGKAERAFNNEAPMPVALGIPVDGQPQANAPMPPPAEAPAAAPVALDVDAELGEERKPAAQAVVIEEAKQAQIGEDKKKEIGAGAGRKRPERILDAGDDGRREDRARLEVGLIVADEFSPQNDMIIVREYAHPVRPDRSPGDRIDFAETLYWNAGVKTDGQTGTAKVAFALNDSVTAFRIFTDGFDGRGAVGAASSTIESVEPFFIEPKMPLEVTAGDKVILPVAVANKMGDAAIKGTLKVETSGEIKVGEVDPFDLQAMSSDRRLVPLEIGYLNGPAELVIRAEAEAYRDRVTRPIVVKPLGFPVESAFGGMLEADGAVAHQIVVPQNVAPRSISADVAIYPTPLANLTQALERLIQEPYGCFEQTSSTTYPLVMAQQYFMSHTGVDPSLIERSRDSLDRGYAKLVGFECKERGYEWFGADPGHEPLTAYGLMEFADMSRVRGVDQGMIQRTRKWLLGTRDGEGGFTRKQRALHTWIEDRDCSNGYILWTLMESGEKGLDKEVAWLKTAADKSANSYVLALSANVMALAGDSGTARAFMERLAAKQTSDGWVDGAATSIVGSGGEALKIETTALAALAWLRDPSFTGQVERSIRYLAESCKGGRFGSTQSTVLALRAIVTYDEQRARPKAAGTATLFVDGQSVGDPVAFDEKTHGAIKLPDIAELLTPGEHRVELKMRGGSTMPYSLTVRYNDTTPASAKDCKVKLAVALPQDRINEGEITEAQVTVTNLADEPIPTPVAIVGLPGGLEPRHDQLKELVKSGKIDAYEVLGREIVLYWRGMAAGQVVELPLSLVAAVPGAYTGPASRAYLYYTDEFKHWIDPIRVTITARASG